MPEPIPMTVGSAAPVRFPWGEIRWLCNSELDPDAEMTFGVVTIEAGSRNDLHAHPNCEEVLFVMEGRCLHRLGDVVHPLEPGAALRIPRGVWHRATTQGDAPCVMAIAYSSPGRQTVFAADQE